jgi:hypothetical protein
MKKSFFAGKVRANAEKTKSGGGSIYGYLALPPRVGIFSPEPDSKVMLDILPYIVTSEDHPDRDDELGIAVPGSLWYKRPFKVHRNIGINNDTVVCPTSIKKPCPICNYRAEMIKKGAEKEEIDSLKPSMRNLYVVVPKHSKKYDEVPHIWDMSHFLFQNLLAEELEENEDYEIFPDLENGLTLRIRFDSKTIGAGRPFAEASRIDFYPRERPYDESILNSVPKLDEVLIILPYEKLESMFYELDTEPVVPELKKTRESGDSDETEKESEKLDDRSFKRSPRPKIVPRPSKIIQEDEDDEDDLLMGDEEEETQAASQRAVGGKADNVCSACGGSGRDSLGKTCRICRGTGKPRQSSNTEKERCPHGHKFGVDTDEFPECDTCRIWDECIDVKEENAPDIDIE